MAKVVKVRHGCDQIVAGLRKTFNINIQNNLACLSVNMQKIIKIKYSNA